MDINQGLDYLSGLLDSGTSEDFSEVPVSLEEFLYGNEYLKCPPLSTVQYEFVEALSDIYKGCKYTEVVGEWGKGGGKDFTCAVSLARIVYCLECLRDPAAYYGLKSGSRIDAINIAVNSDQAGNVFFVQFRTLLDESPYFRKLGYRESSGRVSFPKKIRSISGHSEMEGLEGHNVIVAILDEIDAFKTTQETRGKSRRAKSAKLIYDRMRSSSQSRFPGIGKTACISFPRFYMSYIQQRRIAGLREETTFVSAPEGVPTWVANPIRTEEDFADEFKRDPEMAASMYACKPPMARDSYIRYHQFVLSAFGAKMEGYEPVPDELNRKPIREVHGYDPPFIRPREGAEYFVHVDLAKNRDRAGFAIAEYDGVKLRVPLMWGFEAPVSGEIDFDSIVEFICKLSSMGFSIRRISYDRWQSVGSLQKLRALGYEAATLSIKKEHYDTLKDLLYSECVDAYFYQLIVEELLGLELIGGQKVDHKPDGSSDVSCSLAGACWGAVKGSDRVPGIVILGEEEGVEVDMNEDIDKDLAKMLSDVNINIREERNAYNIPRWLTEED